LFTGASSLFSVASAAGSATPGIEGSGSSIEDMFWRFAL
jgi:hypothetical protein